MNAQYVKLSMIPSGVMPTLYVSQYDVGRPLGLIVTNGTELVDMDSYSVTIEATRSDGTQITAAVTTADNIGTFQTTATMTNVAGIYKAQLVIAIASGKRIASIPFLMNVTAAAMDENGQGIAEDQSLYQQYTGTVQTLIATIRADLNTEIANRQSAVSAEAAARQAADNTLQSNINAEASSRATTDASLQSQINQLVAPSGEAPSAAEVENARIGADGVTYPTLGDAIRTNDSLLKSQIGYSNKENGVPVFTGTYMNGTTLFTSSEVVAGTEIFYHFTATTGTAGYLEFFDLNNQRITYIGKGSSSSGSLEYEGSYILPSEFSYVKANGTSSIYIDYIRTEISNTALFESMNDITGMLCKGRAMTGLQLFTANDVSEGEILYFDVTADSGNLAYIELLDANSTRIGVYGKITTDYGATRNIGVMVIPSGFNKAVMGGSGTIRYIQKNFPSDFLTELQEYVMNGHRNLLDGVAYRQKRAVKALTGEVALSTAGYVSMYIPVFPKSKINVDFNLGSTENGYGFYDATLNFVNGMCSNANNMEFYVPDNAYFMIATVTSAIIEGNPHAYITLPTTAENEKCMNAINPYRRFTVHQFGTLFNGYNHIAFPRMCYFNGKTVVVYRTGYQHMPKTDGTLLAAVQIDTREPDGTWKHIKSISASNFVGITGDARDFYIQPTRSGDYLLMVGGFTHYVDNSVYYDCVIAVLDENLDIVGYKTFINNDDYFFGNPLVTPTGHIILTAFNKGVHETSIYRSDDVFTGDVSTLEFTKRVMISSNSSISECCLGYFNDKLVFVNRYDLTYARIMVTNDLEGLTGWTEPASIGISIHSPLLLPYYHGKYLPVVGSLRNESNNRDPVLYYLDVDNVSCIAHGIIDTTLLTAYNGYPSFVPMGGEEYDVIYYQESPNGTSATRDNAATAIYYKRINARQIIPALAYIDV